MGLRRRSGSAKQAATATTAGAAEKVGRAARRAGAATERAAEDLRRRARKPLTAARAKRVIGVSTAVAPLLAPYALAAAGVARSRWDTYRAGRLGVAADQLSAYRGRGGALHARLSRVAEVLAELDSSTEVHATGAARRFATDTRPRLADLSIAVRAAELMPSTRRRTAFRAIDGELGRIEAELLAHLGIRTWSAPVSVSPDPGRATVRAHERRRG